MHRRNGSDRNLARDENHFHCASGFATRILAHVFDSLVRVSRRVGSSNFARITNAERWDTQTAKADNNPQHSFAIQGIGPLMA